MPYFHLLAYLENEVFFPVLGANGAKLPGRRLRLQALQCRLIDILRENYYCDAGRRCGWYMYELTLRSPVLRACWEDMRALGFKCPLDPEVSKRLLELACETEECTDHLYRYFPFEGYMTAC